MKDYIYPLKLSPFLKRTIWGGQRLSKKFGKPPINALGETWELSARDNESSIISNGPCAGMKFSEYVDTYTDISSNEFPLLIKFIDAEDRLSVQVHPDDVDALRLGLPRGKTEMWYILDADEDSSIVYGLKRGETTVSLRNAVQNGRTDEVLNYVKVRKGDIYFIPGGLVHAIGKGIVIAEIQQNSDTTFRLYDYDRSDASGQKRPLHVNEAIKCTKSFSDRISSFESKEEKDRRLLCSCEYFAVSQIDVCDSIEISTGEFPFISLLCISGKGIITWNGGDILISAGDSFYIPGSLQTFSLSGQMSLIYTTT